MLNNLFCLFVCLFCFENYAVCETMWKNIVEPYSPQMIIWHMHIACWICKSTNTYSDHVLLIAFPLQRWLHEHTSVLCCVHCLSCF